MPKRKKFNSKKKKINKKFVYAISIPIIILAIFIISPFSPFSDLSISGNDLIKNFSVVSYDGQATPSGIAEDGKLITEYGADWTIAKDGIEIIDEYDQDGYRIVKFSVKATNKFNFFTAVNLGDATETNLEVNREKFTLGTWIHKGMDITTTWGFGRYLYWSHYDFGDVRAHNVAHNTFSGTYKFSFDIDGSPLPDFITDEEGNTFSKEFSYIGVETVKVKDNLVGSLSNTIPTFVNLESASYTSSLANQKLLEETEDRSVTEALKAEWNPRDTLSTPVITTQVQSGIIPQTPGSSLNPTTRLGAPIWDPENTDKSMPDCAFTYNIASLSPIVNVYSSTLTFYRQDIYTEDYLASLIPWIVKPRIVYSRDYITQHTRDVALQVTNRYIHSDIEVKFNIWSKFNITAADVDTTELELPAEWDEDDLWSVLPDDRDGAGGGFIEPVYSELFGQLIFIVLVVLFGIVGIYLFMKIGLPILLKNRNKNRRKRR